MNGQSPARACAGVRPGGEPGSPRPSGVTAPSPRAGVDLVRRTRIGVPLRRLARLRQLGPLTDDNLLIFRDQTPKGRHYTERPGDPLTGLQDSSFGAGCFGNAKSS